MKIESIPRDRTVAERGRAHRLGEIISLSGAVPVALQMPYCIRVHAIRFGERVEEGKKGLEKYVNPVAKQKSQNKTVFPRRITKLSQRGFLALQHAQLVWSYFAVFVLCLGFFFLSCVVECQLHSNGLHFNYICRKVIP